MKHPRDILPVRRRPAAVGAALVFLLASAAAAAPARPADDPAAFRLPFPAGETRVCTQGRGGESHAGPLAYALDFAMPEGAEICAARAGRVAAVRVDGRGGGPPSDRPPVANYIHVEHADGTIGRYLHLKPAGAFVKVGDYVCRGQPLGAAGSTGISSGPHLHVDVWKDGATVPFAFADVATDDGVPQAGRAYASENPPAIPAGVRVGLDEAFRDAELYYRFGACHLAHPLYLRMGSLGVAAEFEPLRIARERTAEMTERVRAVAESSAALAREGKPAEALGRVALARAAFNGLPGTHRVQQLFEELSKGEEGRARLESLRDLLKAQDVLFQGLQGEAGGRPEAAARCYRQILSAHPATPYADLVRPRLAEIEARAPARGAGSPDR
jgi:hypothetical protein